MKYIFLAFAMTISAYAVWAQDNRKQHFYDAKASLEDMLNGAKKPSFEDAIFLIENAWYDNSIKRSDFDSAIAFHVQRIQQLVSAHYDESHIKQKPGLLHTKEQLVQQYKKALTNWAIYTYMTQPLVFLSDSGVSRHNAYHYCYGDPMATGNWENAQVIHLNNTHQGNCFALASLFKILADRLQSDAQLCTAPSHIYISHADEKGVKYNVELGSEYFPGTGMINAITYSTDQAIQNGIAQRTLTTDQEMALALVYLAKGYEHKFNTKADQFTEQCAAAALKHDPRNLNALLLKGEYLETKLTVLHKSFDQLQALPDFVSYQNLLMQLYNWGYREMPMAMKNNLLRLYSKERAVPLDTTLAIGKDGNVIKNATVSWGLFDERHQQNPTERYGNTLFDTKAKKIISFEAEQKLYKDYDFDPVVCALNIDPLAAKYPSFSPYSFAVNSPIVLYDPDGRDARVSIMRNKEGGGAIKIQTVVHVTGKDFSEPWAKFSIDMYNQNAAKAFKDGSYTDKNNNVWQITFDVKYVYEKSLNPASIRPGDNVALFENGNPNIDKDGRAITKGDKVFMSSGDQFGVTTTHESGHLLGLTDRYGSFRFKDKNNNIQTGYVAHQGYKNNLMGGGRGALDLNQDQYNNWGKQLLNMASEQGNEFILKGIIEYETDAAGRNLKVPYTQVGEEDKKEYIDNYNQKLQTGTGTVNVKAGSSK